MINYWITGGNDRSGKYAFLLTVNVTIDGKKKSETTPHIDECDEIAVELFTKLIRERK